MVARRSLLLVVSAALLASPGRSLGARSELSGKHCLGEERTKLLLNHTLAGVINPLGLENQLRLSVCLPLIRKPGVLFDFTNLEIGVANYISPTHVHVGPFLNLTPLSFLVLRAEVTGLFIWPIPLPGAGYIPLPADAQFTPETLEPPPGPSQGRRAYGVRTFLGATLQGQVPLGKRLSLAVLNAFGSEYWRVNPVDSAMSGSDNPLFYLARRDVVIHHDGDWVLANTAVALLMLDIKDNYVLRLGATDDLVAVPATGYVGNIVAGIAAIMVKRVSTLARNLQFFVRAGGYTNHAYRSGMTLAAGLDVYYELLSR